MLYTSEQLCIKEDWEIFREVLPWVSRIHLIC